ncbi:peptidase C65 Otubain-domain-containing protein [Paraphysoderma sedebokerense]|nr:peptidase C65 Otubain-domain-containing protein [Paraphysoderma sedebokerense]
MSDSQPPPANSTSTEPRQSDNPVANITDEQILEFETKIKDEEAKVVELVNVKVDLSELYKEYESGSQVFREKINNLQKNHSHFRRCRGDGNCFYRAFAYAWFERILLNRQLIPTAVQTLNDCKQLLGNAGFQLLAYEDFYDAAMDTLVAIDRHQIDDLDMLLSRFQTDEISNGIVVFFRFVTSAYLQAHQADYYPFVMDYGTMEQFCSREVEAMGRESEEIHIIALTNALNVGVTVAYLDSNPNSNEVNFHEFVPESAKDFGKDNPIVLLYRPGHYDILYRS